MAESIITKNALANSLKELMNEVPFEKIKVEDICSKCGMNRKSFYYHFKDKYDLVNWIFDTEFIACSHGKPTAHFIEFFENLCNYLNENREFYRCALRIKGQNSFEEHFEEIIHPLLEQYLGDYLADTDGFCASFLTDACICAINRWISQENGMSADEFLAKIREISRIVAEEQRK